VTLLHASSCGGAASQVIPGVRSTLAPDVLSSVRDLLRDY
jgi:hypothetical protein